MRLEREFTVPAPPERTWAGLADAAELAVCLPGASMEPVEGDALHRGIMRLDVDGASVDCAGTLRQLDADEDERAVSFRIQGREAAGPGLAVGTVRGRLVPANGATRVELTADVRVTGQRAATEQVEREGERLLDELARGLGRRLADRARGPEPVPGLAPAPPRPEALAPAAEEERPGVAPVAKYGLTGLAAAATAALLGARGRRRGVSLTIRYRW